MIHRLNTHNWIAQLALVLIFAGALVGAIGVIGWAVQAADALPIGPECPAGEHFVFTPGDGGRCALNPGPLPAEAWENACSKYDGHSAEYPLPVIGEKLLVESLPTPGEMGFRYTSQVTQEYRVRFLYWPALGTMAQGHVSEHTVTPALNKNVVTAFVVGSNIPPGTYDGSLLAAGRFGTWDHPWCHEQVGFATLANGGAGVVK